MCFERMSPPRTSQAPPSTSFHFAGELPSFPIQPSRLFPSKSTTAPLGAGALSTSSLSAGFFTLRSLISQVTSTPSTANVESAANTIKIDLRMRILLETCRQYVLADPSEWAGPDHVLPYGHRAAT